MSRTNPISPLATIAVESIIAGAMDDLVGHSMVHLPATILEVLSAPFSVKLTSWEPTESVFVNTELDLRRTRISAIGIQNPTTSLPIVMKIAKTSPCQKRVMVKRSKNGILEEEINQVQYRHVKCSCVIEFKQRTNTRLRRRIEAKISVIRRMKKMVRSTRGKVLQMNCSRACERARPSCGRCYDMIHSQDHSVILKASRPKGRNRVIPSSLHNMHCRRSQYHYKKSHRDREKCTYMAKCADRTHSPSDRAVFPPSRMMCFSMNRLYRGRAKR